MSSYAHLPILCEQFFQLILRGQVTPRADATLRMLRERNIVPDSDLNEAQIRQSFILPLVQLLGWNTEDPFEVYPEERVLGGYVDIRLRTDSGPSVIWEIKRTSVPLDLSTEQGREAAFQGVGYCRTFTQFPFCVVTNFETTHIFHSYALPPKERIAENLIASFTWIEAREGQADAILSLLEKVAVSRGETKEKLDSLIKQKGILRAPRPLHKSILEDLEQSRLLVAREVRRCFRRLDLLGVDNTVQVALDRILFIRCCEDRYLEDRAKIRELLATDGIWEELRIRLFPYFKDRYNSDLFAEHEVVDSEKLVVSDETIRKVLLRTLHSDGEESGEVYDFSIIPLEILGAAYESYLGKQLVQNGAVLELELKPEVKKSGGICYTPSFIVEAIVKNTLDRFLDDYPNTYPKVLDPACGSGTFLIKAFEELVRSRVKYPYKKSELPTQPDLRTRRGILEKCIFGVDLDPRAVEITKLSLLLKLLEGEVGGPAVRRAILPSLKKNIRAGNSLIGPRQLARFAPGADFYRMAPLDWTGFMRVNGVIEGFDVILGNPPYVRIQVLQEVYPQEANLYSQIYPSAAEGNVDIYIPFIERAMQLLGNNGYLGFICPHRFWSNDYGKYIRTEIARTRRLSKLINFRAEQVFEGVTTYTCILILNNRPSSAFQYVEGVKGTSCEKIVHQQSEKFSEMSHEALPSTMLDESPWLICPSAIRAQINRMERMPWTLKDLVADSRIFQGLITGMDPVYLLRVESEGKLFSEQLEREVELEDDLLVPVLKGSADLRRLKHPETRLMMLFPYKDTGGKFPELIGMPELKRTYPKTARYFKEVETSLRSRKALKTKGERDEDVSNHRRKFSNGWFYDGDDFQKYSRNQALNCVFQKKLIVPSLFKAPTFFWDDEGAYALTGSGAGGGGAYAMILRPEFQELAPALVGILSSGFLQEWFERRGDLFQGYYVGVDEKILLSVPLPYMEGQRAQELLLELNNLVRQVVQSNEESHQAGTTQEILNSIESIVEELYSEPAEATPLAA